MIRLQGLWKKATQQAVRVNIQEPITQLLWQKISKGLQLSSFPKSVAVIVTINSPGGSVVHAKGIADCLRQFSVKHNAPIYCIAEDQCLGSANVLLTCGQQAYCSEMTMFGDIGFVWRKIWLDKFADKYDMKLDYIHSGANKVKMNIFKPMKPESEKWVQEYLNLLEDQLKKTILANRASQFEKLKIDETKAEELLFSQGIIDTEVALQYGLIDGIKTLDEIIGTHGSIQTNSEIQKYAKSSIKNRQSKEQGLFEYDMSQVSVKMSKTYDIKISN